MTKKWPLNFAYEVSLLVYVIFRHSVRTSKKTHFTITTINWLMLFEEIIALCSDNDTQPVTT
jgi:hypothetical protein